ncbi:MAG TPA: glycosyltransferase family 4 protein [Gemmatimonadales bacterium]|nr:glycosyltransferase family 4 protein [Gemmatimonadales bacterium]
MTLTMDLSTLQLGKGWFPEQSGGLNRYYHGLLQHLPAAGVEVNGLVAGSDQVAASSEGAVTSFAPSRSRLPARWRGARQHFRQLLAHHPSSLVVSHFALYTAPCLDLIPGDHFVVHFHGPWAEESRAEGAGALVTAAKRKLEQSVYRRAARCIVLSEAFGRILATQHGIDPSRIRVIPGGVDSARFAVPESRAEARARLDWPADRPILFVVRRLVRRMGLENLIDGVRHARALVPDLLVMVAGSGPLARELEARCVVQGVERNVRLLGYLPDDLLPLAYRAADLSIVPSIALEGFGLIVAESLAAGTPVLVTDVGGLPETMKDLSPQCVIRDSAPASIGAAIADAFRGGMTLPSAEACSRHARERFDWWRVVRRVRETYAEVV